MSITPPPPLKLVETPASTEAETTAVLPMVSLPARDIISLQRMKQILAQLSSQQQRLATDAAFLRQQSGGIHSVVGHLRDHYMSHQAKSKQLLQRDPQLLKQLAQITTAALQQLATQRDTEIEVSRAVAMLGDVLSWLLIATKVKSSQPIAPSSPADTANLCMLRDTGEGAANAAGQVMMGPAKHRTSLGCKVKDSVVSGCMHARPIRCCLLLLAAIVGQLSASCQRQCSGGCTRYTL